MIFKSKRKTQFAISCLSSYQVLYVLQFDRGLFVELLEFSEDRSPWESVEEKLTAIR